MDRKQVVRILDRAAARAGNGATSKQTWFLAGLMLAECGTDADRLDRDLEDFVLGAALSRSDASAMIDRAVRAQNVAA